MADAAAAAACGAPNSEGSASGLRSRPCRDAPASPNVAPIMRASRVRGSRMSRTMIEATPWSENRAAITVRGEKDAGPVISDSTNSTATRMASVAVSREP